MIQIVKAGELHVGAMADILNEIISIGGTTALTTSVTSADIAQRMHTDRSRSAWHVAENESGSVLGFQWIAPADYLPEDAAEIATFAKTGQTRLGMGSRLFEATKIAARQLGYRWLNANIRADNEGGLAYYQSRGFETYAKRSGVVLDNGLRVTKILKRYDL